MNFPKYYGNYLGIVVQNNDPQKRGRLKVFVPHISPTVYKKWAEISKDKRFRFLGANVCSDITDIIEDLKKILPWAELAAPLAGESASGRYNAFLNAASISDSSDVETAFTNLSSCEIDTSKLTPDSQNLDGIGEKPGNYYDISENKLVDAFANPAEVNANSANVYSYNYTPECYSNCAKGAFPLLRVGAHVWVFFNDGDPLKPVVFASSFGSEDWKGIHDVVDETGALDDTPDEGIDYPGTYENVSQKDNPERDINTETYRNKYIINQKGGTLSFVNTDNKESVKLTHYSGSFKEFTNQVNIELATNNDQKLVLNDQFLTVKGSRNEFTKLDYDCIVQGNYYKKIGLLNKDVHKSWKDKISLVDQIKRLFQIQRAGGSGSFDKCPTCNKPIDKRIITNTSVTNNKNLLNPSTAFSLVNGVFLEGPGPEGFVKNVPSVGPQGQPIYVSPTDSIGGTVDGSSYVSGPGDAYGSPCKTCGQTGFSPSSQGGSFDVNSEKLQIPDIIKGKIGELTDLERQMGLGGTEITEIAKNKIETVGMVMNDFSPIRIDPNGKLHISEVAVGRFGSYSARTPTPYVEQVQVDDLPGGTYTLNVCNKYNVLVGAGGLNLKSYGVVNVSGAMTNIAGMQVNIGSENEINIDGGKRVSITADVVSIKQRESKQVVVDGSLGVTHNAYFEGGVHVEGELTCNHMTIPMQALETGTANVYATPNTDAQNKNGFIIGFGVPMSNYATVNDASKKTYKENTQKDTGEPYLAFTDATKVVGRLKKNTNIGYFKDTIGYLPIGTQLTVTGIPDTTTPVVLELTAPVAVIASINGVEAGDVPVKASDNGTSSGKDTPAYGSGPGGDADLQGGTVRASIKGADTGTGGKDAAQMPIIIYGTGSDPDSILNYPHSHTYQTVAVKLVDNNYEVRERATSAGDARNPADVPVNAPQGNNNGSIVSTIEG